MDPTFDDLIPAPQADALQGGELNFDDLIPGNPPYGLSGGEVSFDDLIPGQPAYGAPDGELKFNDLIPGGPAYGVPDRELNFDDLIPGHPAYDALGGKGNWDGLIPEPQAGAPRDGELDFEGLTPHQSAPWWSSFSRAGAAQFGQAIRNAQTAETNQQSRQAADDTWARAISQDASPTGTLRAQYSSALDRPAAPQHIPGTPVEVTPVPTPQLVTNPYGELMAGLQTSEPMASINRRDDGSTARVEMPQRSPQSSNVSPALVPRASSAAHLSATPIPVTLTSGSLLGALAADGSRFSGKGDPIVGKLVTVGQTVVRDPHYVPLGAYANAQGPIANVAVDWAGHVYYQYYIPDGNGGYLASNRSVVEIPRPDGGAYYFEDLAHDTVSYTPFTDGTEWNGHINFNEAMDGPIGSAIRPIPYAQPNFDQLEQIVRSPIGSLFLDGANFLGASPSQQQAWLNLGSILEGIGASFVPSADGPLTFFESGQRGARDLEGGLDSVSIVKPYSNPRNRPPYASGQVSTVWNNAMDESAVVHDPNTADWLTWDRNESRIGQWDMGHLPGREYNTLWRSYMNEEIDRDQFLNAYRNPDNYRPESPSSNRSRKFEDKSDGG